MGTRISEMGLDIQKIFKKISELANYIKIGISLTCFGIPIIWHFLDLYYWAFNKYLDGNGMPLLDW